MSKIRKHRRVIALSKIDSELSKTKTPAQIVSSNLDNKNPILFKKYSLEENFNKNVIDGNNIALGYMKESKLIDEKEYTSKTYGNVCNKNKKVILKKNRRKNRPLSEHEKFLLEQCPPHYGKV